MDKLNKNKLMASVALVVGLGVALASTTGSYLTGLMVALPIGLATYYGNDQSNK